MLNNIKHQYPRHPKFWEVHKQIWIQEYDKLDYEHRQLCMREPNGWFAEKQNDRVVIMAKRLLHIQEAE